NASYVQPPKPAGVGQGLLDGLYRFAAPADGAPKARLPSSGTARPAARQAAVELAEDYGISAELWSASSYKALREEALAVERWNLLHPNEEPKVPLVTRLLSEHQIPTIAVSDFMKMVPDQVARWIPGPYT